IRSFYRLTQVDPGFKTEKMLTFNVWLPPEKYKDHASVLSFIRQSLDRMKALPGVENAAAATGLPLGNSGNQTSFWIEGRPEPPQDQIPSVEEVNVTTGYFETMRIPLLAGRTFTDQDIDPLGRASERAAIIDDLFAKRYWPGEDPVGKHLRFWTNEPNVFNIFNIVGVVGRVKMDTLDQDSGRVQVYFPWAKDNWNRMEFTLRTIGDPESLVSAARTQIAAVDPDEPIYHIRTAEQLWAEVVAPQRLNLLLLGI